MAASRNVAILLFNDVELLDFAGPQEVFSSAGRHDGAFQVYTVAETKAPIQAVNNLSVNPQYDLNDCPPPDILIVPGGIGTRQEYKNPVIVDWIKAQFPRLELLMSVCTGSLILAKTGLLDGLNATTHFSAYDLLQNLAPATTVCPGERYLDNGKVITAAGVSAGIDAALHVVARLLGDDFANGVAQHIEYEYWHR